LPCNDLINQYNYDRAAQQDIPLSGRRVAEILGVCMNALEMMYVVRFEDGGTPQPVSRAFIMRHCAKLLLAYYEKNLTFLDGSQPAQTVNQSVADSRQADEAGSDDQE
jgi:hypothetical protein